MRVERRGISTETPSTACRRSSWRAAEALAMAALVCAASIALADEDPDKGSAYRARPTAASTATQTPRAPRRASTGRPATISLAFSNVDVRDALVRIAQYSGVDVLLAPGATGTVSINLRNRTPEESIRMVAASAGLYVTQAQGAYVIGSATEIQRAVSEFGLTEVLALEHVTPTEAAAFLAKTVPTVKAEPARSGLAVSGLMDDLRRAREAVRGFDTPGPEVPVKRETRLFACKTADPEQVEAAVRTAFPAVSITRQERVLIATGPTTDLDLVDKSISAIDVAPPTVEEAVEVAVYRTKYVNAEKAEEQLKKVLPDLKIARSPEPNMPPAAAFYPMTTGSLGGTNGSGSGSSGTMGGGMGGGVGGGVGGGASGQSGVGGQGGVGTSFSRSTSLIMAGKRSDIQYALKALEQIDVAQPLVRIDAALVELSDEAVKQIGLKWSWADGKFKFAQNKSGTGSFDSSTTNVSNFTAEISALINKQKAELLANPNISCVDGEDASIFIGELRRFRGSTVVTPGIGTVEGTETAPVGVALLVRPRVHPDGNITLKVHPVVSTLLPDDGSGLPQTASREADTTVRLREGEELVIGGLQRREVQSTVDKIPLLGDLPLIGELFRSRSHTKRTSEVVVILRAYPVFPEPAPERDFRPGAQPR